MRTYVTYNADVKIISNGQGIQMVEVNLKDALPLIKKGIVINSDVVKLNLFDKLIIVMDSRRCLIVSCLSPSPVPVSAQSAYVNYNLPVYRGVNILC